MTLSAHLQSQGYAITPPLLSPKDCAELRCHTADITQRAGTRQLLAHAWCQALATKLSTHARLAPLLPTAPATVQCTYFEKSAAKNWLVPWHQDLSLPMATRLEHSAFTGWSVKEGQLFTQPPPNLLAEVLAVRLHLDDCAADNGALRVVPGSHRHGRLDDAAAQAGRKENGEALCVVPAGAVLAMRPLLLHASAKATSHRPRRVLHFVFAPTDLLKPFGLAWS